MRKQDKSNTKLLIFGKGQMAGFLNDYFKNSVIANADITKPQEIIQELEKYKPQLVINTAAKTSIDWCELNKQEAFLVNTLGAFNIWEECKNRNLFYCHFSSACIFHSRTCDEIFSEKDKPNPRCYYSWTKVWAENLLGADPNLLILRPRMVISAKVDRRNTISKWLVYSHFISDQNTVSVVEDMLPIIGDMLKRRISGTFNIANKGTISPLEVAFMLKTIVNPKMEINETSLEEVNKNLIAKRCTTILDTSALSTIGYELPNSNDSVLKTVKAFKKNLDKFGGLKSLKEVRKETLNKYTLVQKSPTTYKEVN